MQIVNNDIIKGEYNMDDRKEKTGFWQSWMTITLLLAVAIMVFWFNSQGPAVRYEGENVSVGNGAYVPIGDNVDIKTENNVDTPIENEKNSPTSSGTNTSTGRMDNDTFFKTWIGVSFNAINYDLDCISQAGYKKDIANVERCGGFLRNNSNLSLEDIDGYSISPSMNKLSNEYRQALLDYNAAGMYLETGAKNRNASQMAIGAKYLKSGNMHIEVVNILFSGNESSFVHPKKDINAEGTNTTNINTTEQKLTE